MKLICTQENFKKALSFSERVVSKQATLPILNNILIESDKGGIKLSATNLEIGIISKFSAKVEMEGRITIPARVLSNFVNNLNEEDQISLETSNQSLKIVSGHSRAVIKGLDAQDFPLIPHTNSQPQLIIDKKEFKYAVSRVLGSVAVGDSRQELLGVNCLVFNNVLIFAATDSFRLTEAKIALSDKNFPNSYGQFNKEYENLIIPANTLSELVRIMDVNEVGEVKITIEEGQIFFEVDNTQLVSRLINGKYPEYQHIIPSSFTTKVFVEKEKLQSAIRMASAFSPSRISEVTLESEEDTQTLKVKAHNTEAGEGDAELRADIQGPKQELVFNAKYILDGLSNINTSRVCLMLNNGSGPVVMRGVNEGSDLVLENLLYIAMPINN